MNIKQYVEQFFSKVANDEVEIYNEFSLQHELGKYLKNVISQPYKVQFERNIKYFYPNSENWTKKEIDIAIYNPEFDE